MRLRELSLVGAAVMFAACATSESAQKTEPETTTPPPAEAQASAPSRPELPPAPQTPTRPVEDTYHGVTVTDPYQWLERSDDPEVQSWTKAQDTRTRDFLKELPNRAEIGQRVRELITAQSVQWGVVDYVKGQLFVMKRDPAKQQPTLVVMTGPDAVDSAKTVVDPNALDPSGGTSMDWAVPSPDGKYVAVSLSKGGSESGDLHFFETATGNEVFEVVPRVNGGTAGGDAAWAADGKGVFYSRYPRQGERPEKDLDFYTQIYFHRLGTPTDKDRYEIGKDFPRTAEIKLQAQEGGRWIAAVVQDGDSGRFQHYLRRPNGKWLQLTRYQDKIGALVFGPGDRVYLLSKKNAPRGQLLVMPLKTPTLKKARVIVPQQKDAIDWSFAFGPSIAVTPERLYVTYQLGGPSEIRAYTAEGRPAADPKVPPVSAAGSPIRYEGSQLLFWRSSYTEPSAWYLFLPEEDTTTKTALASTSPADFSDVEVVREFATSKDGTKVPLNIVMKKGTQKDGTNPVMASAYGGYGLSMTPGFSPVLRLWLDKGGIFVEGNVRGGGEYGEKWHAEGSGLNKQNTFDDFAAILEHLVEQGYTKPERLGIIGGSNGGLLMGAIITQHPLLQRAVVSEVGVYDMLRNELTPNGQFNIPEYGTVKNAEQFKVLYGYSPYQHVEKGTSYPAVLLTTGVNDPRVAPWQSKKFAAKLQADTDSGLPILLRVSYAAGHGIGSSLEERIELTTDVYTFLEYELGMQSVQPAPRENAGAPAAEAAPTSEGAATE